MGKRILILSNHFITLYNFRKELIKTLISDGNEVIISMPKSKDNVYFSNMGCKIIETHVDRRGINPVSDSKLLIKYVKIMKEVDPDYVFSYTIKPNIYGSIASNITSNKQVSNVTGTGATFMKETFLSMIAKILYKISLKRSYKVFFQNKGDRDFFVNNKMVKDNYSMLPGSGVNLDQYEVHNLPSDETVNFIFIGRIMTLKGIDEYLQCAKNIKAIYPNTNFYIAGFIEEEKYKGIINHYHSSGLIRYLGFQKDIQSWVQKCHCTVLPSHGGEGIPNVLLESAATGRICLASNINGSNDVIIESETGYLFETGNADNLTEKAMKVINLSFEEKRLMGLAGRTRVANKFNRQIVIKEYMNLIHE